MYHLELRQFPRNLCRYNLSTQELRAILDAWAREERVELGERSWDPRRARITIIDGPRVPNELLTMPGGKHGLDCCNLEQRTKVYQTIQAFLRKHGVLTQLAASAQQ